MTWLWVRVAGCGQWVSGISPATGRRSGQFDRKRNFGLALLFRLAIKQLLDGRAGLGACRIQVIAYLRRWSAQSPTLLILLHENDKDFSTFDRSTAHSTS
jgi:hypothetical protein